MANYFQTDDRDDYFETLHNSGKEQRQREYNEKRNIELYNNLNNPNNTMTETKKEIQLNDSQAVILQGLVDWSHTVGEENLFASLIGSAGTGKTTITKEFIKQCKFKYGIIVSAPTHKAKKVIERATNLISYTIQKLLGLRPNTDLDNFDINFPQFDSTAETEIQYQKLLIIDEASMLNADLFDLIVKEATRYKVKVLFIG